MGTYQTRMTNLLLLFSIIAFWNVRIAFTACEEKESLCTAELLKNVMGAFLASNISIQDPFDTNTALSMAYRNFSMRCRGISENVLRAVRLLTPVLNDSEKQQIALSQLFTRATGYRVEYAMQSPERIAEEVMFQLQTNVSVYDAWVLDVTSSEAAVRAGGVAMLGQLAAAAQDQLQDSDVHPFLHTYGAMYGEHRTAVVLGGVVPLLYWRRDMFAAAGLPGPPATWEELLAVATALNGTDLDGDGRPDAALCWQTDSCLDAAMVLGNILASMTQYEGKSSGWLFRPEDMSPLAAGPPLQRALDLFHNLTRLESRDTKGCSRLHTAFLNGTCAITIKSAQQFKAAELYHPHLRGLVGVAPVPGSEWVWNRAASAWMSCGTESSNSPCRYATLETPLSLQANKAASASPALLPLTLLKNRDIRPPPPSPPRPATSSGSPSPPSVSPNARAYPSPGERANKVDSINSRRRALSTAPPPSVSTESGSAAAQRVWVNRAPYVSMTALLGSVVARTAPEYVQAAFSFFALVTSPATSWGQMGTDSVVGPFRLQHLDPANIPRWLAMNYSLVDLEPFLEANRHALDHPNAALPLRLPGAAAARDVLYWATQQVRTELSRPTAEVAALVPTRLAAALDVGLPRDKVQQLYWMTIGYEGVVPPPAGSSEPHWFDSRGARIGVSVAVSVTGLALVVLAAALYRRRRLRLRRTLFGRALAPGASPATSLVVTDIVDSTRLWETVSPASMTRAIQLHHETLRSLLQLHNGYESATEGDAFILSFYSASDAVAFALRAQAALLYQPWPEELFQHEPCKPQYALCHPLGSSSDRPRAAIPRLPRVAQYGGPPAAVQPGSDENSAVSLGVGVGIGHTGGATGGEEHISTSWLAVSTSQVPLSNTKLKLMTTALSLPLKRRARGANCSGGSSGGGGAAASASLARAGPAARPATSSNVPQLTFVTLPAPPPLQPRDGFASHSLSQLLLNGTGSVRGCGVGNGPTITDGSTGSGTGGSGGRSRRPQFRPNSQGGGSKLRQLRLTMAGGNSSGTSFLPTGRASSAATAPVVGSAADGNLVVSSRGAGAPTASARAIALVASAASSRASRSRNTRPTTAGDITCDTGGAGQGPTSFAVEGSGGSSAARPSSRVNSSSAVVLRSASQPGHVLTASSPKAPAPAPPPFGSCSATATDTSLKSGTVAAAPSLTSSAAAAAATAAGPYVWDSGNVHLRDNPLATIPRCTPLPFGSFGPGPGDGAAAPSGDSTTSTKADSAGAGSSPAAASMGAASMREDGSGGGIGCDSERISAATFTGQWLVSGPPQASAAALSVVRSPPRAIMSTPLPRLAAAAGEDGVIRVGGDIDGDGEMEELLAVRGSIRGVHGVESDPEPGCDPDPDQEQEQAPVPPAGLEPRGAGEGRIIQRSRGSRARRSRVLPTAGRLVLGLVSEAGLVPRPGKMSGSRPRSSASGFAATAASVVGSAVTSASGALTASLGLAPYRRTSVQMSLAALVGGTTTNGPVFGFDSCALPAGLGSGHSGMHSGAVAGIGGSGAPARSLSLGAYYQHLFRPCRPGIPGAVLVAGGLSVRMGVHSGVANTQVSYNRVAGRTQYSGAALEAAKAVCDAAQGGMVLLSRPAFEQLAPGRPGGASSGREPPHLVLHMGAHLIKGEPQAQQLYMAQSRELLARLPFLGPVRSSEQEEPGVMEAPLGEVSMGTVMVVGLPTLMAWNKEMTEDALMTFRRVVVTVAMRRLGGHLVEEEPGRVMAAFGHPFDAIRWAAACESLLKEADWSEALLSHELAEEVQGPVLLDSREDAPVLMGDGELSRMLFRGLRIKGAVDSCTVKAELLPSTGRLNYRGNLTTNVQRIAAYVSTGQVVCTRRAWRGYEAALDLAMEVAGAADVQGACLGPHSIRGVGDKVELWSIRMEDLTYEASYHEGMGASGAGGIDDACMDNVGGRALSLMSPPMRAGMAAAAELASPAAAAAAMGGDMVGSRLGASLADRMAVQSRAWDVSGEELRNMLGE